MAKSIPALVTPKILVWARNLDGFSLDEVAAKLHVKTEQIEEWEQGVSHPTLLRAKKMAQIYRVPFVYFYLPDVPQKTKRIEKTDYRTFGNIGDSFYMSHELSWLLRDIEARREAMLDLYGVENRVPEVFPVKVSYNADDEEIAKTIRNLLELNSDVQRTFRKPENALSYCAKKLEQHDVLVFQAAKIQPDEMRGLSIAYEQMPIIVVNRKDEPSARLFTLCHELAHIVTRTSGICNNMSEDYLFENPWEKRCNHIAGLILVPKDDIQQHIGVSEIRQYGFDDGRVYAISRDYAVSREVILHCLWDMDVITKEFYFKTLERYSEEYKAYKSKQKGGFLPPTLDIGTQVGKLYAQTVLSAYYSDRISARDTSNYLLNLKAKNFGKLESWCF